MTSSKKNQLIAVIEPQDKKGFWILDFSAESVSSASSNEPLFSRLNDHIAIFLEAKGVLKTLSYKPDPRHRIVCLKTIQKLIAKNFHEDFKWPEFDSPQEAYHFLKETINDAFILIEKLQIEPLIALECQVIPATIAMEDKGLPFTKATWTKTLEVFSKEKKALEEKLHNLLSDSDGFALFGPSPIDLNNANAVKAALERLLDQKLEGTSQSSLKDINHDAVKLLLKYREHARMVSTYGENFLAKVMNDRIKGNFASLGSPSGRFACHDPNLLALPSHPLFQSCIMPKPPYELIHFDYGAFELRILAALSKDKALQKIFNDESDIHSMVAKAVFNVNVSKTENTHLRDQAKVLNFGIIYGMGEKALSRQLKISINEAKNLLQNYFKRFSSVRDFLESLEDFAKNKGYVKTALGRRAYFTHDEVNNDRGHIARIARNMPIQGTGADIIKLAMCRVFNRFHDSNLDAHLINVVHDELVVECNREIVDTVKSLVKQEMEQAFSSILADIKPFVNLN